MIEIFRKEVHNPDDVTIKYLINNLPDKLFLYFGLPGEYLMNYPVRIVKRDGSEREMDWLLLSKVNNDGKFEEILTNSEFQYDSCNSCTPFK